MAKYFNLKGKTPKGELQYPKLQTPDTKYDTEGVYSTNVVLGEEEHAKLLEAVQPAIAEMRNELEALPKRKRDAINEREPFTPEYDDNDDETGRYIWKFRTKAEIKGVPRKVALFDAKGSRLQNVNPWGGTEAIVAYTASPYIIPGSKMAGVSLRLEAVQVLRLVSGGSGGSASGFGFGAVEGYDAIEDDEDDVAAPAAVTSSEDFGGDEDDSADF